MKRNAADGLFTKPSKFFWSQQAMTMLQSDATTRARSLIEARTNQAARPPLSHGEWSATVWPRSPFHENPDDSDFPPPDLRFHGSDAGLLEAALELARCMLFPLSQELTPVLPYIFFTACFHQVCYPLAESLDLPLLPRDSRRAKKLENVL